MRGKRSMQEGKAQGKTAARMISASNASLRVVTFVA